ncbi:MULTISPECIES: glycosyltransferase [unclassified Mesorhizobium]|uniref:glycosyltransferase n=1 Tax=unclassified Mesorhizobium TaxID=325217 RepID=UPI000FE619F3|nr:MULTISPECIES: glycosyltransferase [unclassified Mesorhizobium]RWB30951.1 MAG: glycosyltransferase family 1 protein [Mesorhizobium sp.]RWB80668.1 MAG: glycosyltransferase family 1 protein [Mesorhizobium sp.]RWC18417.1 MAG: glycosyltransferase family 1 protein [Mesorhizobium sp.]RWC33931.1 MAG: glycosyltransferase family 1 protein [Mesorhizobium sp.]RWD18415.1 MAG: glycosyltransferase family 1 protein [Mesorhizobium sp.]
MPDVNSDAAIPRIALISTHGYVAANPPLGAADTGGQVVYVLELAKKLAQLGYAVDIWTRRFEDQPPVDEVADGVRVLRVGCGGPNFIPKEYLHRHLLEWCENALRLIRRENLSYDFINSHYWDAGVAGQRVSEALNIPHIHTPHSLGIWKQRQMKTDYPDKADTFEAEFNFTERIKHETIIYRSCAMVIATTPPQVDMLVEDYSLERDRVHMIPPGYDDNRFFPVSEASRRLIRHRLGFEGRTILALGRLATNKGYDLLIDAFSVVAPRVPDAVLRLAVGGENMDEQEQKILNQLKEQVEQLGLQDRVVFSGYVADEDLADTYRAADMFVLSSRYEPFGMTAIEAMACGTPTVVTIHGGLYRGISYGRHALFGDPFDKEDLGITIVKPMKHQRLYGRLGRMGAHKARSLFTWTGIAQQLVSLVEGRPVLKAVDDHDWDEPWNDGD